MHEHYEPIVEVAVSIGRLIYDHLVGELGVDRRYITTSVTRMGARLDVDWRAFGPRRCWMVAAVIRTLERRLFPSGLGDYEERLREVLRTSWPDGGEPKLHAELDTRMFEGSDRTRLDGSSRGGTIRGIGSLHSASSNRVMWVRSTPVPHEAFHPAHARRLTEVSRNHKGPMPEDFADPRLFSAKWLLRQPAYRAPQGDARIEPAPNTCARLVALFDEASTLVDELGVPSLLEARERAGLQAARDPGPRGYDVTPEIVRAVAYRVDGSPIDRTSYFRLVCPQCGDQERSAKLFMDTGSFQCFRCNPTGPIGLVQLARMASCLDLVPVRRHSTSTVRRIKLDECDDGAEEPPWSAERVEAPEVETVVEAREAQRVFLEEALASRDQWDMLVLRSPTGTGKTTMAEDAVAASGLLSRGFYARAEGRNRFLEVLQPSRAIDGRQVGGNCHNPKMARATELGCPPTRSAGPSVKSAPAARTWRSSRAQKTTILRFFTPISARGAGEVRGRTDKRVSTPEIAIIDENPGRRASRRPTCPRRTSIGCGPSKTGLIRRGSLRRRLEVGGRHGVLGGCPGELEQGLSLETSVCTWIGRTPAIEQLIARLVELLHPDSMLTAQRRTLGLRPKRHGKPDETTFVGVLADAELRAVLAQTGTSRLLSNASMTSRSSAGSPKRRVSFVMNEHANRGGLRR
ncbi:MAG: hypothetical protein IPG04_08315 [Polyangiaceae bacterium]|nr:hypothetical protein [Polyangiaceae bacterium]